MTHAVIFSVRVDAHLRRSEEDLEAFPTIVHRPAESVLLTFTSWTCQPSFSSWVLTLCSLLLTSVSMFVEAFERLISFFGLHDQCDRAFVNQEVFRFCVHSPCSCLLHVEQTFVTQQYMGLRCGRALLLQRTTRERLLEYTQPRLLMRRPASKSSHLQCRRRFHLLSAS